MAQTGDAVRAITEALISADDGTNVGGGLFAVSRALHDGLFAVSRALHDVAAAIRELNAIVKTEES
jgi:hypothetical protein